MTLSPSAYIAVHPKIVNGYLAATLVNKSDIDVSEVRLRLTVNQAEQSNTKTMSIRSLQRSSTLSSRWKITHLDELLNVTVDIIGART